MRPGHFDALRPVCPVCRRRSVAAPLRLAATLREEDGHITEGVLHCSDPACQHEYPILDGIPLLVPDLRSHITSQLAALTARDDLSETLESIIGDCCGPNSAHDTARQHLSIYTWDHYADLDPHDSPSDPRPGSAIRVLDAGMRSLDAFRDGPILDLGCSVGRTTFALAERRERLVLGVDLNFAMLRLAARVLRRGEVRYARRRVGLVYDRRKFAARFPGSERVDFWACDAMALPFAAPTFALAVGLNVLDCVPSPRDFLAEVAAVLKPDGVTILATPYDWSPGATQPEAWLGGHSQRGPGAGASEPVLRALLTPGAHPQSVEALRLTGEVESLPWHVRLHDRSSVAYKVHLVTARREASAALAGQ